MKYIIISLFFTLLENNVFASSIDGEKINIIKVNNEAFEFILPILSIVISIISIFISLKILSKELKKEKIVEKIESYPPKECNSAEIGYRYKGEADSESVMSLLIYLANKGYLKISPEVETKMLVKQQGFRITKLKEYDGSDENERIFMEGLFENKNIIRNKVYEIISEEKKLGNEIGYEEALEKAKILYSSNECTTVTYYDLNNYFYKIERKIRDNTNSRGITKKKVIMMSEFVLYVLALAVFILSTFFMAHKAFPEDDGWIAPYIFTAFFGLPVVLIMHKEKRDSKIGIEKEKRKKKSNKIFYTVWLGGVFSLLGYMLVFQGTFPNIFEIISLIIGFISTSIVIYCALKIPFNDMPNNDKKVESIIGFINFLETVDREKLEMLVSENPNYFYDIYPYVYSLGLTKIWKQKFKDIIINLPDWCEGFDSFNIEEFDEFIHMVIELAKND